MSCPFCKISLHEEATVCPGCGAEQGYSSYGGGVVHGRTKTAIFTVYLPMIVGLLVAPIGFALLVAGKWFPALLAMIFGGGWLFHGWSSWRSVKAGPHWYARK